MLAYDALEEVERIERVVGEYEAVLAAVRMNYAVADAKALNAEYQRAISALRFDPDTAPSWTKEEMQAAAQRLLAFRAKFPKPVS